MTSGCTFESISSQILDDSRDFDFAGFDPFDGLNSKLFNFAPSLKQGLFGLAWIQFHKRSVCNFRTALGVEKARNPKGIGLFILGLLEDFERTGNAVYLDEARGLGDWLLEQKSDQRDWKHACWGYHFDWKARAFYVPKGKPNIITTVYVAQALYALGLRTGNKVYIDTALDSADFMVDSLYEESGGKAFFAYIPGENTFVHNANLWGAAWVAIVGELRGDERFRAVALRAARQSVAEQNKDGSWVYGTRHHHQFIDGFHTGYNLEALHTIRETLKISEFNGAIERGLMYYKSVLVEDDGTAKYYHDNRYPLDMHSVTQVVITLLKVSNTEEDMVLARKVIERSLSTLYLPAKNRFMYQKNKNYSNKVDYIRWTQAWVYYSFSLFNRVIAEYDEKN